MPQEEIIIDISPEGEVTVKTQGFKGKSCQNASKIFEDALGKVESVKKTAEYHLKEEHQVIIKQTEDK